MQKSTKQGRRARLLLLPLSWGVAFLVMLTVLYFVSAAGALGDWLQRSPKTQVYLNRIAGTVFAALALKLAAATNNA